jgi:heme oxygenase
MTVDVSPTRSISLRKALQRGAAAAHRHLESRLSLLEPGLDARRYRRVLELLYGFYAPMERVLTGFETTVPFPLRARSAQLENDLSALGIPLAELVALPRCDDIPRLSRCEDLAGCLYVLEGASLGGQVVAPVLRRRLGLAKGTGASYFAGDEDRTAARWAVVLEWLDGLERTSGSPSLVVAAANATFEALVRWVDRQEPSWSEERHG